MSQHSFAIAVFLGFILLSGPITMTGAFAQQPQDKIPSWIKNNAEWWADGAIDDSSFLQGIQYLIKENIIDIPTTTQGSSSGSNAVPGWVKNNAGWWAEGAIDESSFVQGIQFLIEEGVMQISSTESLVPQDIPPAEQFLAPQETIPEKNKDTKKDSKDPIDKSDKKEKAKKDIHLKIFASPENLVDQVQKKGKIRVIVELNTDFDPKLPKEKKMKQKADIKAAQKSLMDTLSSDGISSLHNFKETPQIAMTVNADSLDQLISSGLVKSVQEDRLHISHLDLSLIAINATTAIEAGLDGSGKIVVIIDTGVDKNHPFLYKDEEGDRVVSEACFTSIPPSFQSSPGYVLCDDGSPNGVEEIIGNNSGLPCASAGLNIISGNCDHGTHVAGIAAGADTGFEVSGVAKGVDIISINVFTIFEGDGTGAFQFCPFGTVANPTYCLGAFESDIIAALEHVKDLYDGGLTNISSVGISEIR